MVSRENGVWSKRLGARSSSVRKMQKNLNLKVKWKALAPSVLKDDVSNWFELNEKSPYELM